MNPITPEYLKTWRRSFAAALILSLLSSMAYGQADTTLSSLTKQFSRYQQQNLHEKLFVHMAKDFHLAGELLWFKVYCVDETFNKPLDFSKLAYVEVLDDSNTAVLQAKIALENGSGNGSLYLPVSLVSGNYQLRAYTNWMKNFSPELYFHKTITIVNTLSEAAVQTPADKDLSSLDFFPEGGSLVSGIQSKIAFKMTGKDGKGFSSSGFVLDQKDTVARFTSLKFGMGSFLFTPVDGKSYVAKVRLPDGKVLSKELPPALPQGYVMQLIAAGESALKVTVTAGGIEPGAMYLIVHSGQQVTLAEVSGGNGTVASFIIPKEKLGAGVSYFTVFDRHKQAVCERLYFKQSQTLTSSVSPDQARYPSRVKATINVSLPATPQDADLSMAVYRLDTLEQNDPLTISDYLGLFSNLKGNIESPSYYTKNDDPETREALDNLLLVNGWRKIRLEELSANARPGFKFLPEYNGHIVSGKVTDSRTNRPASGITVFASVPGKKIRLFTAKSDVNGAIIFNTTDLYASNELVLQAGDGADSVYRVEVVPPFSTDFAQWQSPPLVLNERSVRALHERNVNVQVQQIFAGAKQRQWYTPPADTISFFDRLSKKYLLGNYVRFNTMEEVLREYVFEITVGRRNNAYVLNLIDPKNKGLFKGKPLMMVDGVPVFNMDKIVKYDPLKMKMIEVAPVKYFLGSAYFEGLANFSTYAGDLAGFEIDRHATVVDYEGLQLKREFYAPVYDTDQQKQSPVPDFRDLLFWEPAVQSGKKQVSFYTSDQTGKYMVVLQGVTTAGKLISTTTVFNVTQK